MPTPVKSVGSKIASYVKSRNGTDTMFSEAQARLANSSRLMTASGTLLIAAAFLIYEHGVNPELLKPQKVDGRSLVT
jgi:hypothetical protein